MFHWNKNENNFKQLFFLLFIAFIFIMSSPHVILQYFIWRGVDTWPLDPYVAQSWKHTIAYGVIFRINWNDGCTHQVFSPNISAQSPALWWLNGHKSSQPHSKILLKSLHWEVDAVQKSQGTKSVIGCSTSNYRYDWSGVHILLAVDRMSLKKSWNTK